jgi:hypothetical protein
LEKEILRRKIKENWRKKSAEFFFNKEKDQVMKTKEKLGPKRLFRNLLVDRLYNPVFANPASAPPIR